ncbi:YolA family protein [Steroidobacter cummioxidans]|uniref:YolA family protein n=1 Tax=Steroidobacter cummioxidans TaxID=1803913 RepID=UPI000E30E75E|nr:YolA family protein [Steroidobacter cummioxidans]
MSKGFFTLAGVLLASSTVSVVQAQKLEASVQPVITTFPVELTLGGPLAKVPAEGLTAAAKVVARAPAPPLTRELVYAVGSTQYGGWEYMTTIGQMSTVGDHGGAQLRVVVQEIGYGNNPLAWMAGSLLPLSANYQNDAICISGNYYVSPCPVGGIVVGWYRYYNLDGWQDNLFQYQNTSTNSPYNTLSTSINIL